MKSKKVWICVAVLAGMVVSRGVWADQMVQPGDVVDPEGSPTYTYTLSFDDLATNATTFADDFVSTNLVVSRSVDDSNRFLVATAGATNAEASIVFDFSESGFRPSYVEFVDSLYSYTPDEERVQQTSAYSVNGTDWITLNSLNQGQTFRSIQTNTVAVGRAERVYYRVTATVLPEDNDGVFTDERNQWNRVPAGEPFKASFSLVEPAIVVGPGDVVDPETNPTYSYTLTFDDMGAGFNKFTDDFSYSNFSAGINSNDTIRFVAANAGQTSAVAMVVWNFEPSGFAPTNVVFSDSLWALSTDLEHVQQRTEFSVNGTDWTEISSLNRYEQKPTWNAQAIGVSFTLDQPDRVYYRVTFEVLENDDDGVFTSERNQWNRTAGQTLVAQFGLSEQTGEEPGVSLEDFVFPAMGSVSVSFLSENGVEYALEYTTDLAADPQIWTPATGDNATQTGDGNVLTLEDDDPSGSLRIYRVVTP